MKWLLWPDRCGCWLQVEWVGLNKQYGEVMQTRMHGGWIGMRKNAVAITTLKNSKQIDVSTIEHETVRWKLVCIINNLNNMDTNY